MKIHVNPTNPEEGERGYDKKATVEARVIADRIWFDEGYREAEKGEMIKMSPEDFDNHELEGKVEPEQVAADRDKRNAERAAKKAAG